jgi:hypothetical protein
MEGRAGNATHWQKNCAKRQQTYGLRDSAFGCHLFLPTQQRDGIINEQEIMVIIPFAPSTRQSWQVWISSTDLFLFFLFFLEGVTG